VRGGKTLCKGPRSRYAPFAMSIKEQTLAWLAELPDDASIWPALSDDARLLLGIAEAEADVREGRERPLEEVQREFEAKWTNRRSKSS